jgi:dienelactone hydrolase
MKVFDRRRFLRAALSASLFPLAAHAQERAGDFHCSKAIADFICVKGFRRTMLRTERAAGPAVILLHELPGMTPYDLELARRIANHGFTVYLPLLFGAPGQNNAFSGYFQSCAYGEFECSKLSTTSPIVKWLQDDVCKRVEDLSGNPIGIIGMCLTGIIPLALLRDGIAAAVLCQPTLPFNLLFGRPIGEQKQDLGLAPVDLENATRSTTPLLAMRYASDPLCPEERINKLRDVFQKRLATIDIEDQKGHSTLANDFHPGGFADAVKYLRVRLGAAFGPQEMTLARLDGQRCEITADGTWRALP